MTDKEQRAWVDQHAIAFALGALDEEEDRRFREAIRDDEDFAELANARDEESIGHVPAALIARWDAAGRVLDAHELELLERHTLACADCREELELLAQPVVETSSTPHRTGGVDWRGWLGGIVLGAAAMLAFIMFTSPQLPGRHAPGTSVSSPPSFHLQGKILEVVTPRAMRGATPEQVELSANTTAFLLALNLPIDVATQATASVVVLDPSSRVLSNTVLAPAPWIPPSTQILILGDPHFSEGEYRVVLRVSGESAARSLGRFRIAVKR